MSRCPKRCTTESLILRRIRFQSRCGLLSQRFYTDSVFRITGSRARKMEPAILNSEILIYQHNTDATRGLPSGLEEYLTDSNSLSFSHAQACSPYVNERNNVLVTVISATDKFEVPLPVWVGWSIQTTVIPLTKLCGNKKVHSLLPTDQSKLVRGSKSTG
jgi:hypothetical protein